MKSPLLQLSAAGNADLVKETLDFRVDSKLVGTIKEQGDAKDRSGLGVPILVSGTFASPKFRPDVEGLAKDKLKQLLSPSDAEAAPGKGKVKDIIKGVLPRKQ
jgi:AsmA protein